ncbi:MAG: formate--tetrahydrofolate ligase, partial [Oscillospiraceae bacterium]|nr:formate--tetrahydrofolate ligase [Oscillospiraceae bacterium]
SDTEEELALISSLCYGHNIPFSFSTAYADGAAGSHELAEKIVAICDDTSDNALKFAYEPKDTLKEKIGKIAKNIYGASGVAYSDKAQETLAQAKGLGYESLPVCMAKTQYSLSDNPALLGRPADFELNVKDIIIQTGAGFVVALTGEVMIMPGLPKVPNAEQIDLDEDGNIINLS